MKKLSLIAAALIAVAAVPASATTTTFDFYKLGRGAANGDFLPTDGIACTGGDLCSSNVDGGVRNGDLTFTSGGIKTFATASYNGQVAAVIQDATSNWNASNGAGLGVYHLSGVNSDDNITIGEKLTLSFNELVTMSSIGLRADGHNFTNWATGATFLLNGVSTLLPDNIGSIALNLTGKSFDFAYGGAKPAQFYLASATVAPVPEPGTYALMLGGLGVAAFVARRRRPQA